VGAVLPRAEPLAQGKCKHVSACVKEAGGKVPSQRTETGYKAGWPDESAKCDEVQPQGQQV